jgi:hypothetical protein
MKNSFEIPGLAAFFAEANPVPPEQPHGHFSETHHPMNG